MAKPPLRTPPGGPGKFSRRTDAQGVKTPNVGERDDLQHGDRAMLERGQDAVPVRGAQGSSVAPSPTSQRAPAPQPPRRGELPDFLFGRPSDRPTEPVSAGIDIGAGPGEEALLTRPAEMDFRSSVLQLMVDRYGSKDAADLLNEIRTAAPPAIQAPPASDIYLPEEAVNELPEDDIADEDFADGELMEVAEEDLDGVL